MAWFLAAAAAGASAADLSASRAVSPGGASSWSNYVTTLTLTSKSLPVSAIVFEVLPAGWVVTNWSWIGTGGPSGFTVVGGVTNKWLFLAPAAGQIRYETLGSNVVERTYPLQGGVEYDDGTWTHRLATTGDASAAGRDTDGDGMPDDWEDLGGLSRTSSSDAAADPDGDGMPNAREYEADTGPQDSNSVLRVLSLDPGESGAATLRWTGGARSRQEVCAAPAMTANPAVAEAVFTNPPPTAVTNERTVALPFGDAHVFYFLRVRR